MSQNPFESPIAPASKPGMAPAGPKRPTSLTVFGVLNLIFGILGVCGMAFGLFGLMIPVLMPEVIEAAPNPVFDLLSTNMVYAVFSYASIGVGFIFSVVLMIGGFGLLNAKSYGRKCSIWYGVYSILAVVVGLIVNGVFLFPIFFEQMDGPQSAEAMMNIIGNIVGSVVGLIYPCVLLFFMFRPNVVAAVSDK